MSAQTQTQSQRYSRGVHTIARRASSMNQVRRASYASNPCPMLNMVCTTYHRRLINRLFWSAHTLARLVRCTHSSLVPQLVSSVGLTSSVEQLGDQTSIKTRDDMTSMTSQPTSADEPGLDASRHAKPVTKRPHDSPKPFALGQKRPRPHDAPDSCASAHTVSSANKKDERTPPHDDDYGNSNPTLPCREQLFRCTFKSVLTDEYIYIKPSKSVAGHTPGTS